MTAAGAKVRYFYDCEFVEDGRTIDLISIGVVCEDGREYYAVSAEFDPSRAGAWVRRHVLPHLPRPADPAWRSMPPAAIPADDAYFDLVNRPGVQSTSFWPLALATRASTNNKSDRRLRYLSASGLMSLSVAASPTARRSARRVTVRAA